MNLVEDLKTGTATLPYLENELGIKIKDYEDRIVLNYFQINSPKSHPYVMQSRGLIVRKGTFDVLCRSFDRFFNYGEVEDHSKIINWNEAIVFEKVDGSLIKIYHDGVKWCVATRGTAFAESDVGGWGITFEELVLKALKVNNCDEFNALCDLHLNKEMTHLFEVTAMENRVVTNYAGYKLWYLMSRYTETGVYVEQSGNALGIGAVLPRYYTFKNNEECLKTAAELPDLQEGYVVYQYGVPVCKIKSPSYVAVHHIRGEGLSPKRIAELVLTNEQDEYLKYFPEDETHIDPYAVKLHDLKHLLVSVVSSYGDIEDQKEFALKIKLFLFSAVLFQWKKKGGNVIDVWSNQPLNYKRKLLLSLMGEKDET